MPHLRALEHLFMGEAVGAVVLVPVKATALSAPACALGRGASGEALGFSQEFPRQRPAVCLSRALSRLDQRRAARRFLACRKDAARRLVAPRRYPSLSAALAEGREREPRPLKYS